MIFKKYRMSQKFVGIKIFTEYILKLSWMQKIPAIEQLVALIV